MAFSVRKSKAASETEGEIMVATTIIQDRQAYWDEDHSVWVWSDTNERIGTPYEQAVTIIIQGVAGWEQHNKNLGSDKEPLALETAVKEAVSDVFVMLQDIFCGPYVELTREKVNKCQI